MKILGSAWSVPRVPRTSGSPQKQLTPAERPGPSLLSSDTRRHLGTLCGSSEIPHVSHLSFAKPHRALGSRPHRSTLPLRSSRYALWNISGIINKMSSVLRFLTEHHISRLPVQKLAFLMRHHALCGFTREDSVTSLPSATSTPLTRVANVCLFEALPCWQYPPHHHHSVKTL